MPCHFAISSALLMSPAEPLLEDSLNPATSNCIAAMHRLCDATETDARDVVNMCVWLVSLVLHSNKAALHKAILHFVLLLLQPPERY
jgi:hypothetical protein